MKIEEYIIDHPIYVVKSQENNLHLDFPPKILDKDDTLSELLSSLNSYQLKSLYEFFLKHILICKKRDLLRNEDVLKPFVLQDMNNNIKEFISDDIVKAVFIMNLFRRYFK